MTAGNRAGDRAGDVVVLRALGLGDLLTGIPALRGVRRRFGTDLVTLCTNSDLVPLAALAEVADVVLPVAAFVLGPLPPLPCDVAVNLHGRGPGSTRSLLDLRPQRVIAFRHPDIPETAASPQWRDDEHEVERWCRLLDAHDVASHPGDLLLAPPDTAPPVAGATVVHPGAAAGSRRWPAQRFAEVARTLSQQGHDVLITGSAAERPLAAAVAEAASLPRSANVAGATDVLGLAALVAAARLVVSGDTGVAHLATAYARPSVVLFGPTSPALWGPPRQPRHRVLWAGTTGDPHACDIDPGLAKIAVPDVLHAVADVLATTEGKGAA